MTATLENSSVHVAFDNRGFLTSLRNRNTNWEIARPHGIIRLILTTPDCDEFQVIPVGQPAINADEQQVQLTFDTFADEHQNIYKMTAVATVSFQNQDLVWNLRLDNHTAQATVREAHYPLISLNNPEPPSALINGDLVSTKIFNLPSHLKNRCATGYMAPDHKYLRTSTVYPGRSCSVNVFLLQRERQGLYYACQDTDFSMTFHSMEMEPATGAVNLFMGRLPYLKPGQSWTNATMCVTPYQGTAMDGAAKYRKWSDAWFKVPRIPQHIANMQGWQRVILHHQFGEYYYKYTDLEKIYDDGKKAGLDTILLFGWTSQGMDSGYPVYSADETQGGMKALRENIMKVRAKGGHVILYFNGQLIDTASDFYRHGNGPKISLKRADGLEHRETYNFSDTGNFLREFGNKTFVVACPSSEEWLDILKEHVDQAIESGADGVFFDQLGLASYPCCDPTHGHPVPFTGLMKSKREMLRKLYEYTKEKAPDMALGIECTNDATASYTDFYHIFGNVAQIWNGGWKARKEAPQFLSDDCIFKAAYPEIVISNRNLRDDRDVELHVNRMFLLGSRTDVEIYRCRATIAAAPHYQEYLGKVNQLREKFHDVLMTGFFSGANYHTSSNPRVQTNSFRKDRQLAVILSQNSDDTLQTEVTAPGYHLCRFDSARGDVTLDGNTVTLPPDALAVLLFQKD